MMARAVSGPCGCRGECFHAAHPTLPTQRECQRPAASPEPFLCPGGECGHAPHPDVRGRRDHLTAAALAVDVARAWLHSEARHASPSQLHHLPRELVVALDALVVAMLSDGPQAVPAACPRCGGPVEVEGVVIARRPFVQRMPGPWRCADPCCSGGHVGVNESVTE
jgi:hypothetical protein